MCESCPTCAVCGRLQPQPATIPYLLGLLVPFVFIGASVAVADHVATFPDLWTGALYGAVGMGAISAYQTDPHVRLSGVNWRLPGGVQDGR